MPMPSVYVSARWIIPEKVDFNATVWNVGKKRGEIFTVLTGESSICIKKSIDSQMLTVFALPLVTAATHMCFAFPMIQKILALFNMRNLPLMIGVMIVTVFVFGVFYAIIYKVTSNAYYRIVSGK